MNELNSDAVFNKYINSLFFLDFNDSELEMNNVDI